MIFCVDIQHQFTDINATAVGREDEGIAHFNWFWRANMRMASNEKIEAFDLFCGLNILIQRTSDVRIADAGLARRCAFVH